MSMIDESDNVYDYTEYKLHYLIEDLDNAGNVALAEVYQDVLDAYLVGDIDIKWVKGMPLTRKTRIKTLNNNA